MPKGDAMNRYSTRGKLVWSDKFSIGVPALDEQHRAMIRMVNALTSCDGSSDDRDVVSETLTEMVRFARIHFGEEEHFMAAHEYPDLDYHRQLHAQFLLKAVNFSSAHGLMVASVPERLHEFLVLWWSNHILGEDMKIKAFIEQTQSLAQGHSQASGPSSLPRDE